MASRLTRKTINELMALLQEMQSAQLDKLMHKAQQGAAGWETTSIEELWRLLEAHVARGPSQALDIANFCAMIVWHQKRESAKAEYARKRAQLDKLLLEE